jgi:hypothetical protein
MIAASWLDKKLKMIISSRGTTLLGAPSIRPRHRLVVNEANNSFTTQRYNLNISP